MIIVHRLQYKFIQRGSNLFCCCKVLFETNVMQPVVTKKGSSLPIRVLTKKVCKPVCEQSI